MTDISLAHKQRLVNKRVQRVDIVNLLFNLEIGFN